MKRFNKKGFTIVELVIVIAVIGILAGVLIPTFSSITQKAQQSAALQEATSGRNAVLALTSGSMPENTKYYVGELDATKKEFNTKFLFAYENGAMNAKDTNADMTPAQYDDDATNGYFACYIAKTEADKIKPASGTDGIETDYALAIAKIAGYIDTDTNFSIKVESSYYAIKWTHGSNAQEVRVFYTTDIKDSLIIFMGNAI